MATTNEPSNPIDNLMTIRTRSEDIALEAFTEDAIDATLEALGNHGVHMDEDDNMAMATIDKAIGSASSIVQDAMDTAVTRINQQISEFISQTVASKTTSVKTLVEKQFAPAVKGWLSWVSPGCIGSADVIGQIAVTVGDWLLDNHPDEAAAIGYNSTQPNKILLEIVTNMVNQLS